jgi:hypothetical protein
LDWREIGDFDELESLARQFNISAIGIDNEPEFNAAVDFALGHLPGQRPLYSQYCTAKVTNRKAIPIFEPYLQRYGWSIAKFVEHGKGNLPHLPYLAEYTIFPPSPQSWNVRDLDKFFKEKLPDQVEFVLEDEFWEPGKVKAGHRFQVLLFDQMKLKGEQWRRTLRKVRSTKNSSRVKGREELVPVYLLDRTYGLDTVRDRIYRRKMHFPAHATYNPKDNGNLLHHFLTSDRLPDGWIEPPGAPDHFFHAASFADLCAAVAQREPGMGGVSFTGVPVS